MNEYSIAELQARMSSGALSAVELVQAYCARIAAMDKAGPTVNSVIELNPDALAIARRLDRERKAGRVRGPLHGIPVLIKDNIDTHDRMQTTAGSIALIGTVAAQDAFVVTQLRASGAVLLGKTNLSEWANYRGTRSVSGWSSRGGLTRNPYALDRTAGGSSSGSGAAVAANLCAVAVGTETDGSIIKPAQTNGIVGLKPTLGLLSRSGIIPIAHSQDTAGPMARSVEDAAILLGALTGSDARDSSTRGSNARGLRDYRACLDVEAVRGARIGVARAMAGTDARIMHIFERCLDVLRQLGAVLIDPIEVPNFDKIGPFEREVLAYEFKADLNKYLETRGPKLRVQSLAELIAFNAQHSARVLPYFGQELQIAAQSKGSLSRPAYRQALATARRMARQDGLDVPLHTHNLDAIVAPSGGPAWLIDLVGGDASTSDTGRTTITAVAGYPHLTVPAGYVHGLPLGISFIAGPWCEPKLLALGHAFERAHPVRTAPTFQPSVAFR